MKALVYEGIKNVQVAQVQDPKLQKADDIIVKVTSTAICGSDLHLIHGMVPNMKKGFILGHETMGIVEEAGPEVTKVKKGDTVIILGCGPIGLSAIKWTILAGANVSLKLTISNIAWHMPEVMGWRRLIWRSMRIPVRLHDLTNGGADVVLDCDGVDGKMTTLEKIETVLKLQGGSKSAIEIASQAVRKGGTVVFVGVYGTRYNMFPLGNFFAKNVTLKMGQCPAQAYVDPILKMIKEKKYDPTDIITHILTLDQGSHAYEIFDKKEGKECAS